MSKKKKKKTNSITPKGRIVDGAVAWCNYKWHRGDLTLRALDLNGCVDGKCYHLAILSNDFRKKRKRFEKGEISREELFSKNI